MIYTTFYKNKQMHECDYFTYTHLPSPVLTYPHLFSLFFTCTQFPPLLLTAFTCTHLLHQYSITITYLHLYSLIFTCTHLPSLMCTFLHLYSLTSLTFTCTHLPFLVLTYLHFYSLTFPHTHFPSPRVVQYTQTDSIRLR